MSMLEKRNLSVQTNSSREQPISWAPTTNTLYTEVETLTVKATRTRMWGWVTPAPSRQTPLKFTFPTGIYFRGIQLLFHLELHFFTLRTNIMCFFKRQNV